MSDLENINKSLDAIEGNLKNLHSEIEQSKTSQKAYDAELKALGEKQVELAKALAEATQSLDNTVKGINEDRQSLKTVGQKAAESADIKSYKGGSLSFEVKTAPEGTGMSGAANTVTRGTLLPAYEAGWKTLPEQALGLEDLFTHVPVTVDAINYLKGGAVNDGSAITAEGNAYGQTTFTKPSLQTASVVDIGAFAYVTNQLITNEAAFAAYINSKMQYKLQFNVENQMINGTLSTQLGGILKTGNHTDHTAAIRTDLPSSGATLFDLALLIKADFEKLFIKPEYFLFNPADWTKLCLLKDTKGNYLLGGPQSLAIKSLWGVPVITNSLIPTGKYVLGNFRQAATVYDRQALQFRISDQDGDNFKSNMYTLRVNRRLGFAVEMPELILAGDFALTAGTTH